MYPSVGAGGCTRPCTPLYTPGYTPPRVPPSRTRPGPAPRTGPYRQGPENRYPGVEQKTGDPGKYRTFSGPRIVPLEPKNRDPVVQPRGLLIRQPGVNQGVVFRSRRVRKYPQGRLNLLFLLKSVSLAFCSKPSTEKRDLPQGLLLTQPGQNPAGRRGGCTLLRKAEKRAKRGLQFELCFSP